MVLCTFPSDGQELVEEEWLGHLVMHVSHQFARSQMNVLPSTIPRPDLRIGTKHIVLGLATVVA